MIREFIWCGVPRGQERPRFGGHAAYKSTEAQAYEDSIAWAYRKACPGAEPIREPIGIRIAAAYPIPKTDSREVTTKKQAGAILPDKKPDIDNVAKAILDALNGIAWVDDKQVVRLVAYKRYHDPPGLIVTIMTGEDLNRATE